MSEAVLRQGRTRRYQGKIGRLRVGHNFSASLIFSGVLDACIDGLNEVSPDARANVTSLVERYFKSN
jgi:hypothetical protein